MFSKDYQTIIRIANEENCKWLIGSMFGIDCPLLTGQYFDISQTMRTIMFAFR